MSRTATAELDRTRAETFAQRMLSALNDAGLVLAVSIGHRTGLFDVMAELAPATAREIAAAAGLDARYVREWLAAVVSGGVVEYEPELETYGLPAEHAALLIRDASPDNLAVTAQYIPVLAGVEDRIIECFQRGGGVDYCHYTRFHEVMAEDSAQTVVSALFDAILPLASGLVERLEAGIDALDVGCGAGGAIIALAERFPNSRFVGYDISREAINRAREEAWERGLTHARFEVKDVARLDEARRYDLITAFDAIHDQADPARVLAEIHRALRDDGTFLMQDIAASSRLENNLEHPVATLLYAVSLMHCMSVSLARGGAGLGTMWGRERAEQMLSAAGFRGIERHQLPHDFMNDFYVITR